MDNVRRIIQQRLDQLESHTSDLNGLKWEKLAHFAKEAGVRANSVFILHSGIPTVLVDMPVLTKYEVRVLKINVLAGRR